MWIFLFPSSILLESVVLLVSKLQCCSQFFFAANNAGIWQLVVNVIIRRSCDECTALGFFSSISYAIVRWLKFWKFDTYIYWIQKQNSHMHTLNASTVDFIQRHCGNSHFRFDDILYMCVLLHSTDQCNRYSYECHYMHWQLILFVSPVHFDCCLHKSRPSKTNLNNTKQ